MLIKVTATIYVQDPDDPCPGRVDAILLKAEEPNPEFEALIRRNDTPFGYFSPKDLVLSKRSMGGSELMLTTKD